MCSALTLPNRLVVRVGRDLCTLQNKQLFPSEWMLLKEAQRLPSLYMSRRPACVRSSCSQEVKRQDHLRCKTDARQEVVSSASDAFR